MTACLSCAEGTLLNLISSNVSNSGRYKIAFHMINFKRYILYVCLVYASIAGIQIATAGAGASSDKKWVLSSDDAAPVREASWPKQAVKDGIYEMSCLIYERVFWDYFRDASSIALPTDGTTSQYTYIAYLQNNCTHHHTPESFNNALTHIKAIADCGFPAWKNVYVTLLKKSKK